MILNIFSPWAGANYMPWVRPPSFQVMYLINIALDRTGKEGTAHAQWEKATWPKLKELTEVCRCRDPLSAYVFLHLIITPDRLTYH